MDEKEKQENLQKLILSESKKGNVVILGIEGYQLMPIQDFVKQPANGILYDLNLLPEQILFDNPKSVADWAAMETIRALKKRIEQLESQI
jgi:hypothetical protein